MKCWPKMFFALIMKCEEDTFCDAAWFLMLYNGRLGLRGDESKVTGSLWAMQVGQVT